MNNEHAAPAHTHDGHVPEPGYETRDVNISGLLRFAVGLIVALVVIQFAMLGFQRVFLAEQPRPILEQAQSNIYQQLRNLHRDEEAALSSYGWVDRKAGVVRIPIDRAIDLVAEKGVRFGKGPKTEVEMNSHAGTRVSSPSAEKDAKKPPDGTEGKP